MRQRMWRSILALSVGAIIAGAASANPPSAGCNSCDSGAKAHIGHKLVSPLRIGEGCAMPAGCSSCAAERTFAFGSCKQFFNAGHDCKICNPVYGPRAATPPCVYGSLLNR